MDYAIGKTLNSAFSAKLQKTANADTEDWLYDRREHHLTFKENGDWHSDGENYTRTVHATTTADEVPSYDTSGTDSYLLELGYSSDALSKNEILYEEVDDNANLSGEYIVYDVEELVDGEWDTLEYDYDWCTGSNPMGSLRVGVEIRSTKETSVCNKAVKLWLKFSSNRVPGDTTAGPDELETPGDRLYLRDQIQLHSPRSRLQRRHRHPSPQE